MEKHINSSSGEAKQCNQCKYTNCCEDGLIKHKLKKHPIDEELDYFETDILIQSQIKHTLTRPKKGRWIVRLEKNRHKMETPHLFLHCENEKNIETAKELRGRILAESRRMYVKLVKMEQ